MTLARTGMCLAKPYVAQKTTQLPIIDCSSTPTNAAVHVMKLKSSRTRRYCWIGRRWPIDTRQLQGLLGHVWLSQTHPRTPQDHAQLLLLGIKRYTYIEKIKFSHTKTSHTQFSQKNDQNRYAQRKNQKSYSRLNFEKIIFTNYTQQIQNRHETAVSKMYRFVIRFVADRKTYGCLGRRCRTCGYLNNF